MLLTSFSELGGCSCAGLFLGLLFYFIAPHVCLCPYLAVSDIRAVQSDLSSCAMIAPILLSVKGYSGCSLSTVLLYRF